MKYFYSIILIFLHSISHAQNKVNVACLNFTMSRNKSQRGIELKKLFETALSNSATIWNVVEREEMDIFFQKVQEENNLEKDFKQISKRPELAIVDYIIIGDIELKSTLDKYKLDISFIKLRGEQVTTKIPLQFSFTKEEISDDDTVMKVFTAVIKDFTESHFIFDRDQWIKAPNFYNEMDKRDSTISGLKQENAKVSSELRKLQKNDSINSRKTDSIEILKTTTPDAYPYLTLENDSSMYLHIHFNNSVPIKIDFWVNQYASTEGVSNSSLLENPIIYPPKSGRDIVTPVDVHINSWILPKNVVSKITLHFSFESIFYVENRDARLHRSIEVSYAVDPSQNTIVEFERKGQPTNLANLIPPLSKYSYFVYNIFWQSPNKDGMMPYIERNGTAFFIRYNRSLYLVSSKEVMTPLNCSGPTLFKNFSDTVWLRIFSNDMKTIRTFPINIANLRKNLTRRDCDSPDFVVIPIQYNDPQYPIYSIEQYLDSAQNYDSSEVISTGYSNNPDLSTVGIDKFLSQTCSPIQGVEISPNSLKMDLKLMNTCLTFLTKDHPAFEGRAGSPVFVKGKERLVFGGVLFSGTSNKEVGFAIKSQYIMNQIAKMEN